MILQPLLPGKWPYTLSTWDRYFQIPKLCTYIVYLGKEVFAHVAPVAKSRSFLEMVATLLIAIK